MTHSPIDDEVRVFHERWQRRQREEARRVQEQEQERERGRYKREEEERRTIRLLHGYRNCCILGLPLVRSWFFSLPALASSTSPSTHLVVVVIIIIVIVVVVVVDSVVASWVKSVAITLPKTPSQCLNHTQRVKLDTISSKPNHNRLACFGSNHNIVCQFPSYL
jgi:uncharacterized membrane protein YdbT with pleckstrin-like domain